MTSSIFSNKLGGNDMVGSLVEEIRTEIFTYLDAEDLWKCLQMSRAWRRAANVNRLWKIHCTNEGLQPEDDPPRRSRLPTFKLCRSAEIWFQFMSGPVYNWKNGVDSREPVVVVNEDRTVPMLDSTGRFFAIFYTCSSSLKIYEGQECSVVYFPTNKSCVALSLFPKYIMFYSQDGLQIFHLCFNICKSCEFYSNNGRRYSGRFGIISSGSFDIVELYDSKMVTIKPTSSKFSMKDLLTDDVQMFDVQPDFCIKSVFASHSFLFFHDDDTNLSAHDKDGKHVFSVNNIKMKGSEFCANDYVLCIFYDTSLTTFDLKDKSKPGKHIGTFPLNFHTRVVQCHPIRSTLFMACYDLSGERNLRALCPRSGRALWCIPLDIGFPDIHLLVNRFVHTSNCDGWKILDMNDGSIVRQGRENVKHVSDYYSVAQSFKDKKVFVSYYGHDYN